MYFALLGKTPQLSLAELELLHPTIHTQAWAFVFFDLLPERVEMLAQLAGIIKRGKVIKEEQLAELLKDCSLIGVSSQSFGVHCKKTFGVKRFKLISEPEKSDKEIKKEWVELIEFKDGNIWVVLWRQDIDRFEAIDFEKPVRGMQVGMMPAKLTQMLINIGVATVAHLDQDQITIYDPFVGFGTTTWIANSLGYHGIGSDINISPAKQNHKWRTTTPYFQSHKHLTFFKHDVTSSFDQPFLQHVSVIVTEWWLGPVVNNQVARDTAKVKAHITQITDLYTSFLRNTQARFPRIPLIMTVPVYLFLDRSTIEEFILDIARDLGYSAEWIGEVYHRKGQLVGRRVVVIR